MSRNPAMNAAQAEAAIGPRGSTPITSANRHLVRTWLAASGIVPAEIARTMSVGELDAAYNGLKPHDETRNAIITRYSKRTHDDAPGGILGGGESIQDEEGDNEGDNEGEGEGDSSGNGGGDDDPILGILQRDAETRAAHYDKAARGAAWAQKTGKLKDAGRTHVETLRRVSEASAQALAAYVAQQAQGGKGGQSPGQGMPGGSQMPQVPGMTPEQVRKQMQKAVREAARNVAREQAREAVKEAAREIAEREAERKLVIQFGEEKPRELPDGCMHMQFEEALRVVEARVPLALIGPAGSGKTTACEQIAKALSLTFYIQGAVSGTHELLGFMDAMRNYQTTPFRQAFEHGGLLCMDEIDAGDAGAILVMNSALANDYMAFPDKAEPVKRHPDFYFVACANTYGQGADRLYVGRAQLDAATLDRFYFLSWFYDERLEARVSGGTLGDVPAPSPVLSWGQWPADQWLDYVRKTRRAAAAERVRMVVSPRASIYGTRLAARGFDAARLAECLIWKGIDADTRTRVEARAAEGVE